MAGTAFVVPLVADGDRVAPGAQLQVWRTDDCWGVLASPRQPAFPRTSTRSSCAMPSRPTPRTRSGLYLGGRDGSVYASADEGGSWHEVAKHLPDVLCVRAASI